MAIFLKVIPRWYGKSRAIIYSVESPITAMNAVLPHDGCVFELYPTGESRLAVEVGDSRTFAPAWIHDPLIVAAKVAEAERSQTP